MADFLGRVVWLIIVGRISLAEFLGGISWRQCLVEFFLAEILLVEYFGRISWPYFLSEFLLGAPKFGPPSRRTLSRASGGIFSIFIFSVDLCQASAEFTNEMHKRLRIRLTCASLELNRELLALRILCLVFAQANPLPPHIVAYVALCTRAHQDLFPSFVFDVSTLRPLRITSSASRRILIYFMRALLARDADARVAMSPQVDHFDFLLLL